MYKTCVNKDILTFNTSNDKQTQKERKRNYLSKQCALIYTFIYQL